MADVRDMVIFLPNPVGDVVMATPALRALRERFRSARIVYVGRAAALATLAGSPWADETIEDRSHRPPAIGNFYRTVRTLRSRRFDLAVLLPNSLRAALLAWLGGARRIAGYARGGRSLLLSERLAPPRDRAGGFLPVPTIDYYLAMAAMLGAPSESRKMELAVLPADQQSADELLARCGVDPERPLVMLNPGAAYGASKMWLAERWAAAADELIQRRGAQVIVNAAPVERPIAAAVAGAMRHKPAVNFADRDNTLGLLKGLMRRCTLLITTDTGARHFGAAMGIGVVSLFGSTDPVWAQIDYPLERTVRVQVDCSPCQQKTCPNPPGGTHHQCMQAITVEMVLRQVEQLLDRLAGGAKP